MNLLDVSKHPKKLYISTIQTTSKLIWPLDFDLLTTWYSLLRSKKKQQQMIKILFTFWKNSNRPFKKSPLWAYFQHSSSKTRALATKLRFFITNLMRIASIRCWWTKTGFFFSSKLKRAKKMVMKKYRSYLIGDIKKNLSTLGNPHGNYALYSVFSCLRRNKNKSHLMISFVQRIHLCV